jgi:hypothetical protein
MIPPIAKTVDIEIFDLLNQSLDTVSFLSDIQLQGLIRKANTLNPATKYACLSALYSHAQKDEQAFESAVSCMESYDLEQVDIENTFSALTNAKLFTKVVELSKIFPEALCYDGPFLESYQAALYILDLDYCDVISTDYDMQQDPKFLAHKRTLDYLEHDKELVSRASTYFAFVFDNLASLLAIYPSCSYSLKFAMANSELHNLSEVVVKIKENNFDKIFELESKWLSKIAEYEIFDNKLCDISFSMEPEH